MAETAVPLGISSNSLLDDFTRLDPRFIDETGNRYGRLLVTGYAGSEGQGAAWHCKCDCGGTKTVLGGQLRANRIKTCGLCSSHGNAIQTFGERLALTALAPCQRGCPLTDICLAHELACEPFKKYCDVGGRVFPDPKHKPTAEIYRKIFGSD